MTITEVEKELKEAINGLLMMSETDEPFEFYHAEEHRADDLNEETARKLAGMPADYPTEVVEVDYFFRNMTRAEDGDPASQERAKRFQNLQENLQSLLQDVKVYRIGTLRITALILGKTDEGEIAGLKTVLVET